MPKPFHFHPSRLRRSARTTTSCEKAETTRFHWDWKVCAKAIYIAVVILVLLIAVELATTVVRGQR